MMTRHEATAKSKWVILRQVITVDHRFPAVENLMAPASGGP
jgi:hypothetical protein